MILRIKLKIYLKQNSIKQTFLWISVKTVVLSNKMIYSD